MGRILGPQLVRLVIWSVFSFQFVEALKLGPETGLGLWACYHLARLEPHGVHMDIIGRFAENQNSSIDLLSPAIEDDGNQSFLPLVAGNLTRLV
ncbi:hypothetical protein SLA2020_005730 [Shorea laevis]